MGNDVKRRRDAVIAAVEKKCAELDELFAAEQKRQAADVDAVLAPINRNNTESVERKLKVIADSDRMMDTWRHNERLRRLGIRA